MTKKETMIQMLKDVLDQFGPDPKIYRCIAKNGKCLYNPPERSLSAGCAIGMYIDSDIAKEMDNEGRIDNVPKAMLPKWMQKINMDFLLDIQSLHDSTSYWAEVGLTITGKFCVNFIISKYTLSNFKHKYLN